MTIQQELDTLAPIERLASVDSTQVLARRKVQSGEIGDHARFIVADIQTGGVGRFGRTIVSPKGGLWCTLVWPMTREPARVIHGLGLRVGVALIRAVEHVLSAHGHGERVMLKWPNDAILNGRKIGGVLCETMSREGRTYAIVGVGVNANFSVDALPAELRSIATTLADETGANVNLERLTQEVRRRLCEALSGEGLPLATLVDVREHLYGVGHNATITLPDRTTVTGVVDGLTDEGRLRMRTNTGEYVAPLGAEIVVGG